MESTTQEESTWCDIYLEFSTENYWTKKPFDPFTSTLAEAEKLNNLHETDLNTIPALVQFITAQELEKRKDYYKEHPLKGVALCIQNDLVAPLWLAYAFLREYRSAAHGRVRTWDEAFGPPLPKGTNLALFRRARINTTKVINLFSKKIQENPLRSVNKALWEEIGREVGEGATRAEELYREARKLGRGLTLEQLRSRGMSRHDAKPTKTKKHTGLRRKT
ncbi:hypothetical protein HZU83_20740 [Sphaerotilus montanus]|uniref:Uncharacterized protein n=1 Tax=Sphaerotilus montanus TaxID=522889 RepID=A0A7Y9QVE8_9BURK|nr:hypothetical protein [Sphaerotilus montanus]NYG31636.1 hypothetical protein [Sphaerotilus montanus]NZD59111.1 hypothetical protein [Sphaerotilus montanus]